MEYLTEHYRFDGGHPMEIQETIRTLRTEKGLTQEQVAKQLGVSAPAMSKWETGASYPDIMLLPPLARLLGVDLNTLLSFEGDLDDRGINKIMEELRCTMEAGGYRAHVRSGP